MGDGGGVLMVPEKGP